MACVRNIHAVKEGALKNDFIVYVLKIIYWPLEKQKKKNVEIKTFKNITFWKKNYNYLTYRERRSRVQNGNIIRRK